MLTNNALSSPLIHQDIPALTVSLSPPKGMWILSLVKMWESFSFYGMRGLLILYMTSVLNYQDTEALQLYALYTTLIEVVCLMGGALADRFLGSYRSIRLGGWLIVMGHILLFIECPLYVGLSFIIVGTGLFNPNTMVLLGQLYKGNQEAGREKGFTLYYASINIGGFLAGVSCGYVGQTIGWSYGFGLAAVGMVIGMVVLRIGRGLLGDLARDEQRFQQTKLSGKINIIQGGIIILPFVVSLFLWQTTLTYQLMPLFFLIYLVWFTKTIWCPCTKDQKRDIAKIVFGVGLLVIFFALEEQIGSSLVLFADRYTNLTLNLMGLGTVEIPSSCLVALNPFVIMIFGPFIAQIIGRSTKRVTYSVYLHRIALGFLVIGGAYSILWGFSSKSTHVMVVGLSFCLIAMSELFIAPVVLSITSSLSPLHLSGTLMGFVSLGYAGSSYLGGIISHMMIVTDGVSKIDGLTTYQEGFLKMFGLCLLVGIFCYGVSWVVDRRKINISSG